MTYDERKIWSVISDADRAFEKAGDAGTKTWMRGFFFPALKKAGLRIVDADGKTLTLGDP